MVTRFVRKTDFLAIARVEESINNGKDMLAVVKCVPSKDEPHTLNLRCVGKTCKDYEKGLAAAQKMKKQTRLKSVNLSDSKHQMSYSQEKF